MNDDQLDHELRELLADRKLDVNPEGQAAVALRERIVNETSSVGWVDVAGTSDEVTEVSIADLSENGRPPRRRHLVLAAACIAFIAALGFGLWSVLDTTAGPVLTDETDDSVFSEADLIVAPDLSLIAISRGDSVSAEAVESCIESVETFASGRGGSAPMALVTGFAATETFDTQVVLAPGTTCTVGDLGVSTSGAGIAIPQRPLESFEVRLEGSGGQSSGLSPEGGDDQPFSIVNLDGVLGGDVANIQILDPEPDEQIFRRVDSTFLLNAFYADGNFPTVTQIEVTFEGGQVVVGAAENFAGGERASFPCEDARTCVTERLQLLSNDAQIAGHATQAEILADGELTQSEYDDALAAFEQCLASVTDGPVETPAVLADGSADALNAQSCFGEHLEFVDQGRVWHNQIELSGPNEFIAPAIDLRPNPEDEPATDQAAIEVAIPEGATDVEFAWADAAVQLFEDGLAAEELDALWDGFPLPDRKAEFIADYELGFGWVQSDPLSLSLNNYVVIDDEEVTPIVTVQSQAEPSRVAAFVLGLNSDQTLSISRLPSPEAENRFISQEGRLVTHSGFGTSGPPELFGDVSVSTDTDLETLDTTIALPEDFDGQTPLTIVAPTVDGVPTALAIVPDAGS